MHSTVQTGLYTPNIFNYDHNFHHPNQLSHSCHHFPPPPLKHHNQQQQTKIQLIQTTLGNTNSLSSTKGNVNHNTHSNSSGKRAKSNMLHATDEHGKHQRSTKITLSSSNLNLSANHHHQQHRNQKPMFSSSLNLNNNNLNSSNLSMLGNQSANKDFLSKSASRLNTSETNSGNLKKSSSNFKLPDNSNTNNKENMDTSSHLNFDDEENLNENYQNQNIANDDAGTDYSYKMTILEQIRIFFECSKPCGILTVTFGIVLFAMSIAGFFFLFEASLCEWSQTCSNALLQVCSVSSLVIGIVLTLIGFVIVVYSKRDNNTEIIIATGKNFQKLNHDIENFSQQHNNTNNSKQAASEQLPPYHVVNVSENNKNVSNTQMTSDEPKHQILDIVINNKKANSNQNV